MFRFGAVILAAGYSSRMNAFKALLPIGNETAASKVLSLAREAGACERVLVTGYEREKLEFLLTDGGGIKEAYNENFDAGMFTSIQRGTEEIDKTLDGFLLMPVDCPALELDILKEITESAEANPGCFVVPCYMHKKGHPLFVPMRYASEIIASSGEGGFKAITDKHEDKLLRLEVESESVILDMDTEADYKIMQSFIKNGPGKSLTELAKGRRIILIRHGQTQQHKEKIFLGQTDVPLGIRGEEEAKRAGLEVQALKPRATCIYSSDLKRAADTAEIIKDVCGLKDVVMTSKLKETALGAWDGKPIELIKEKYPEAYEKRGKDIFKFKFDHNSENFFDMQFRVVRELKRILAEDSHEDIIVVAHKGVARAIENHLRQRDVSDDWDAMQTGEVRTVDLRR